jgi:hypothetical protein
MSNLDDDLQLSEPISLSVRPRQMTTVSLAIPQETLEHLREMAIERDMSLEALLKFYIGKGLRHDRSQRFIHPTYGCSATSIVL